MEWTPEKDRKLREWRERGATFPEVAKMLEVWFGDGFSVDSCRHRFARLAPVDPLPARSVSLPYYHEYFDSRGVPKWVYEDKESQYYEHEYYAKDQEILIVSDLHIDQHDEGLLDKVLNKHSGADTLVVAGDALDVYAYSSYSKPSNRPIEQEIENWIRILSYMTENFPWVVIIDSNHLARIPRTIQVPMGLGFLANPSLMRHLAQPFPNVVVIDRWWTQIGDALITHAESYKGRAPKTADKVNQYFRQMSAAKQLPVRPWRVLVQAHTHQVGSFIDGGVKILECGCLARLPLEYTTKAGSVAFAQPHVNGYAVLVQHRGNSNLNLCREYYLEAPVCGTSPATTSTTPTLLNAGKLSKVG